jgi:hypothetical protein
MSFDMLHAAGPPVVLFSADIPDLLAACCGLLLLRCRMCRR